MNESEKIMVAKAKEEILARIKQLGGLILDKIWLHQTIGKEINMDMKAAYNCAVAQMVENGELNKIPRRKQRGIGGVQNSSS